MKKTFLFAALLPILFVGCWDSSDGTDINRPGAGVVYDPKKDKVNTIEFGDKHRIHEPDINSDKPGAAVGIPDNQKPGFKTKQAAHPNEGPDVNSLRPGAAPE